MWLIAFDMADHWVSNLILVETGAAGICIMHCRNLWIPSWIFVHDSEHHTFLAGSCVLELASCASALAWVPSIMFGFLIPNKSDERMHHHGKACKTIEREKSTKRGGIAGFLCQNFDGGVWSKIFFLSHKFDKIKYISRICLEQSIAMLFNCNQED